MSWPTDGLPRYVLARTDGILEMPQNKGAANESAGRTKWHATFAILDRAFCHRVVAQYRSEEAGPARGVHVAALVDRTEIVALERLAEFNGERVAA